MNFTTGQAIDFIETAFGKATLSNQGLNAAVVCPKCADKEDNLQKRKLVIRTDDFLTHCWVCGYRSTNLVNLLSRYHPHLLEIYRNQFGIKQPFKRCMVFDLDQLFAEPVVAPKDPVTLPEGFTLLANHLGSGNASVESAWRYLKGRGVTKEELWLWKFGVTSLRPSDRAQPDYRFRVIVPSFDLQGTLNYFSARTYWKGHKGNKYTNPKVPRELVIFNELNIDWTQELTLVEGVFDLIKCNENATCLLGSTLDASYLLFQRIVSNNTPVLLALDNDAKGKTYELAKLLAEYGITVRLFRVPGEYNDVGQMTRTRFIQETQHAKLFTMEDYFRYKLGAQ